MKLLNVILLGSTLLLLASCSGKEKTDNAQIDASISPVIPKVNSTVVDVLVADNENVKTGDTLVILDDATFQIAVKQAEVALALAQQNVVLSKSSRNTASSSVATVTANSAAVAANMTAAKAGVDAAQVKLNLATKNYERYRNLLEQKSATQQQFDGVKAEKDAAEAQLTVAQAQVTALGKQIEASKAQVNTTQSTVATSDNSVGIAELAIRQAENALEMAKLQLSYCVITAPADGVVSKKNVQKGQVVSIGQPLMAITDDKEVWVVANYKETQIENMKVGQEADIELDAYGDKTFHGKIESFSQATGAKFSLLPPDNATGNFVKVTQRIPVRIRIEDADKAYPLRAGMSVYVTVKTK